MREPAVRTVSRALSAVAAAAMPMLIASCTINPANPAPERLAAVTVSWNTLSVAMIDDATPPKPRARLCDNALSKACSTWFLPAGAHSIKVFAGGVSRGTGGAMTDFNYEEVTIRVDLLAGHEYAVFLNAIYDFKSGDCWLPDRGPVKQADCPRARMVPQPRDGGPRPLTP